MQNPILPADTARRHAVENAVHHLAPSLGLAGPAAAIDLATRAVHEGADVSSAGIHLPSGKSLESYLLALKDDPDAMHFFSRPVEARPLKDKPDFNGVPRKNRATAKLDSVNGAQAVKL